MIRQMSPKEYHALGHTGEMREWWLSKSFLFDFAKSPFAWKDALDRGIKKQVTANMDWGSAVDCLVTTPGEYATSVWFHDAASWQGKAAALFREAARANGKIPMLEKDRERIPKAAAMVAKHLDRHGLLSAQTQVAATSIWEAPSGRQYALKCLADFYSPDSPTPLADLKTTNSLDARDLARTIRDFGYHWQAASYLDIFRANGIECEDVFDFHFQESDEPFRTRVWRMTAEDIERGRKEYEAALRLWDHCVTHDVWPGEELEPVEERSATYES